jgi:2-polyprenyl-3-methyl-5-hydroxy-6-metoxy-1,4-benzoquinol methylase
MPTEPEPSIQPRAAGNGRTAARYYDRNTAAFLRFGGGRASGSIHRQLWGPDVASVAEAANCVNLLLGDAIAAAAQPGSLPRPVVLDLGCGVGGTLRALAGRFPGCECHGVTISERQAAIGASADAANGVDGQCKIVVADFESVRLGIAADFVIAIEAFVHSSSVRRFFATVATHLRPGGRPRRPGRRRFQLLVARVRGGLNRFCAS